MDDITLRQPIQWACSSATNVGTIRTVNEDAILSRPEIGLWVVADGMGGHEAGNVASRMVVDALGEIQDSDTLGDFAAEIENRISDVNDRLLEYSQIMFDGRLIGSTFISLVISDQTGICQWMGDSRLYLYRGNELIQLSRDHSHVSELLQAGEISEEEAVNHPEANVITRAVGTSDEPHIDLDVFNVRLGDVLLLCSDGLYNAVSNETITACLTYMDPKEMVTELIHNALESGATDNVSVIAIKGIKKSSSQSMA